MLVGYVFLYILGGLMIVTSLLILIAKSPRTSAVFYAIQAALLVVLLFTMAMTVGSDELWEWGITAVFTKIVFVPLVIFLLVHYLKKIGWDTSADAPAVLKPWWVVLIALVIVGLNFLVTFEVRMPDGSDIKPVLAMGMSIFFIGVLGVVCYRNLAKLIFAYCIMENSAHMTMAVLSPTAPTLMESGVATDAVFGTIIFAILVYRIYKANRSLDSRDLEELKG